MSQAPPLPPRPQAYEVRVEAQNVPDSTATMIPLPPTIVLSGTFFLDIKPQKSLFSILKS